MKKNVAVIPARGGSKGIPRKNVLPVCGKPMIVWSIEAALSSKRIDAVYVSTDDQEITEVASRYGAEVITRPAELADDSASSESALLHALECIPDADVLVFLQCTSPLTLPEDIDGVIRMLHQEHADSCLSVSEFNHFIWKQNHDGNSEGINHDKSFRPRRQDREPQYLENGAVYAMRVNGFKQSKHRFFGKTSMYVMPQERCFEVDELADMKIIEAFLNTRERESPSKRIGFSPAAVVFDFDGVFTDNKVYVNQQGIEAVRCDRSDGWGIAQLKKTGVKIAVLSTEENGVVQARCEKLKVDCYQGLGEKKFDRFESWCREVGIDMALTVFVGNDDNDVECLNASGYGIVPCDAYPKAQVAADLVLEQAGGAGAVRKVCEIVINIENDV